MNLRTLLTFVLAASAAIAQTAPAKPAPAQTPATSGGAAKSWNQLNYPKLGEVKLPPVKRYTLANGMKLFLVEDHTLPLIDGTALIRAGSRWVPADKTGLAGVFGQALRSGGTKTRTGDQIDETLEGIAATIETSVAQSSAGASFSVQKGDIDKVLAIYADILMNPEFRQDKIDLAKVATKTAITRRNDDASDIARREFRKVVYGPDSPYAAQAEYWTVDAVTRADLAAYHARYYHPNNMILGVWGDFDAEAMKAKIEKAFEGWKPAKLDLPPVPQIDPSLRPSVTLIKKDDVNQSNIRVGHAAGRLDDPDYFAADVMAAVLCSGGFSSRISRHVRSELGLAYDASGDWAADYDHAGMFVVGVGTKSETTEKAIEAVMKEIRDIREKEVSDEELKNAKEGILNTFVFNFEDIGQIVGRLMTYEYYGYPAEFLQKYKDNVEKVTKADVLRVAQRRLQPMSLSVLAVGKDTDFDKPLTALNYAGGKVNTVDVTILEKRPTPANAMPGAGGARQGAPAASDAAARPVLERAQKFMGGLDKLKALKDVDAKAKAKITTPQGEFEAEMHTIQVLPAINRIDIDLTIGFKIVNYFDGETGWSVTPAGASDMTAAQKKDAQEAVTRNTTNLLTLIGNPVVTLDKKEGDNDVLVFTTGALTTRLLVSPTGEVVKRSFKGSVTGMGEGQMEETLSDYRDVGGVKLPFKSTITFNGQKYLESEVTEAKINTNPDKAKLAEKPK